MNCHLKIYLFIYYIIYFVYLNIYRKNEDFFYKLIRRLQERGCRKVCHSKQTTGAIVKELFPLELKKIKKNNKKFIHLIDLLNYYVNQTVPKINTKVMLQSWVRKLVKETYGVDSKQYKYLKQGFSMSAEEKTSRDNEAQEKVCEKNKNQIELTEKQIHKFIGMLKNDKFKIVQAIILAQLVSGSRLIEILSNEITFTEAR